MERNEGEAGTKGPQFPSQHSHPLLILSSLPPSPPPSLGCTWQPEFGSWMVESTPNRPYGSYAHDLLR